ncbi:MAG: hypothetical protein PHG08_01160 [Bacilli bacterium]|nr:hypothetical protein [Bacilli bacterium]
MAIIEEVDDVLPSYKTSILMEYIAKLEKKNRILMLDNKNLATKNEVLWKILEKHFL